MLKEKIKEFIANGKPKSKEVVDIMTASLQKLQDENIEENVIKVGEKLPNFELTDAHGNKYTNKNFVGEKLVLNFFRGSWWPYCNLELGVLEEMQEEMEEVGGKLISISPEKIDESKKEDVKDAESLITGDINNSFAKKLGLVFKLDDDLVELYGKFGIDLEKRNGNTNKELPMPATIITDSKGIVVHVFAKADYLERMEPEEIIEILEKSE